MWLPLREWQRAQEPLLDADAMLTALEPSIADPDPSTRERAVSLMYRLATPRALERLAALLGDTRQDLRAEAAIAPGEHDERMVLRVVRDRLAIARGMLTGTPAEGVRSMVAGDPGRGTVLSERSHLGRCPDREERDWSWRLGY